MRNVLLCLILTLLALPLFADGVQPEGSGTEADPYQIATLDNLLWVSTNDSCWGDWFIQTADIDASDTQTWNDGQGWSPIGTFVIQTTNNPFTGSYNGQGYTIDDLWCNRPDSDSIGFFGCAKYAYIDNVRLTNAYFNGEDDCGALIGRCSIPFSLSGCFSSGEVVGNGHNTGGLIGYCFGFNTIITTLSNLESTCDVWSAEYSIGGLVGICYNAKISDSHCSGNVNGACRAGGFIGYGFRVEIIQCYSTGDVHVGAGFIGQAYYCTVLKCHATGKAFIGFANMVYEGEISQCYATGASSSASFYPYFFGFCSFLHGGKIHDCFCFIDDIGGTLWRNCGFIFWLNGGFIQRCYSVAHLIDNEQFVGFIAHYDSTGVISECFWDTETSGCNSSTVDAGTGLTTAQMQDIYTYLNAGWDFVDETANGTDDIWAMSADHNDGYPYLAWEYPVGVQEETEPAPLVTVTRLDGNYPNPFNPTTTIHFTVAPGQTAKLDIYNVRGRRVCGWSGYGPGEHAVAWDGRDAHGRAVASGVYLCRLSSGAGSQTHKMMLLK